MRRAIIATERQMEEAYVMAKNVAVTLLKRHMAAGRERNQSLAKKGRR